VVVVGCAGPTSMLRTAVPSRMNIDCEAFDHQRLAALRCKQQQQVQCANRPTDSTAGHQGESSSHPGRPLNPTAPVPQLVTQLAAAPGPQVTQLAAAPGPQVTQLAAAPGPGIPAGLRRRLCCLVLLLVL
jgi:hypothetical protein